MDLFRIPAILLFLGFVLFPCAAEKAPNPGELATAVENGDLQAVDRLLSRGADPDRSDLTGRPPLYGAVVSGSLSIVERLLEASADPDAAGSDGLTPLMAAVAGSRSDIALVLLNAGADPNIVSDAVGDNGERRSVSALSLAVDRGEFLLAGRLAERGADGLLLTPAAPNAANPLNLPSMRVPLDARIWRDMALLDDFASSPDWTADSWPLHEAVRSGDWRGLREVLDGGANPDARDPLDVTPLMVAAKHGDSAAVSLLLQRGASPGAVDSAGRNVLCYAAASGRTDIAELIVSAPNGSESVGRPDDRSALAETPEYYAVIGNNPRMLEFLLDRRDPPEAVDEEGITLLMVAAWMSDYRAVRMLLPVADGIWESGPPGKAARDDAGRTALEWSLAAFARDRRTGRETGVSDRAFRNYPIARLLARRSKDPSEYGTVVTPDAAADVIEAWSVGRNPRLAGDWRDKLPAPVPGVPGDGDLILYRILRDEEAGTPPES